MEDCKTAHLLNLISLNFLLDKNSCCHLVTRPRLSIGFPFGLVLFCFLIDHTKIKEIFRGLKVNSTRESRKYCSSYRRWFFPYTSDKWKLISKTENSIFAFLAYNIIIRMKTVVQGNKTCPYLCRHLPNIYSTIWKNCITVYILSNTIPWEILAPAQWDLPDLARKQDYIDCFMPSLPSQIWKVMATCGYRTTCWICTLLFRVSHNLLVITY